MLNLPKCVVKRSSVLPIANEVLSLPEGLALTRVIENGNGVLKLTAGTATEYFAGVSQNRFAAPQYAPITDNFTIPAAAPYTVQLTQTPYGTDRAFYINGVIATVVASGPTAGQVAVSSTGLVTFAAADAGKSFEAIYRYAITMVQAAMLYGWDAVPFLRIPELQTTVFECGTVFTDQYVMSDDWASATYAYTGANGQFTAENTGAKVGPVVGLPGFNNGFLGIEINVGG